MAKDNSTPVCILRELEADIKAKIKVKVKLQNKNLFGSNKIILKSRALSHMLKLSHVST